MFFGKKRKRKKTRTRKAPVKRKRMHRRKRRSSSTIIEVRKNPMRKRRRHKRKHTARRRYSSFKRNPSGGIMSIVMSGAMAGLGGIGLLAVSNGICKMFNIQSGNKMKNLIRIGLLLGAAYIVPKYVRGKNGESLVAGAATATTMGLINSLLPSNSFLTLEGADDTSDIENVIRNLDVSGLVDGADSMLLGYDNDSIDDMLGEAELLGEAEI